MNIMEKSKNAPQETIEGKKPLQQEPPCADIVGRLLNGVSTGICIIDPETYEMRLANEAALGIMGVHKCDYEGKKCYEVLGRSCAPCSYCMLHEKRGETRETFLPALRKTLKIRMEKEQWMGREAVVEYLEDVTEQKNALMEIQNLYNNIPGAVFRCKFNSEWTVIEANDGLFDFLGYTREEFAAMGNRMSAVIYPDDLAIMLPIITAQISSGRHSIENENRLICKGGEVKWISIKAQLLTDEFGERSFYCVFVDITSQKETKHQLTLSESKLTTAVSHAGIQFWEYDLITDCAYIGELSQKMYALPPVMSNFPESFLALGYVHPDYEESYRRMHGELKAGIQDIVKEFQIKLVDGEYSWQRIHYSNILDDTGKPVRAIATAERIDAYKELEQRFIVAARQTGVRVWILEMQNHEIEFMKSDFDDFGIEPILASVDAALMKRSDFIYPEDIPVVSRKYEELYTGADSISFEARLKNKEGKYRWTRIFYTCIKSKSGKPVKAIGTAVDVNEHMMLRERFERELRYSVGLQSPNLIAKAQSNVSQNIVESYIASEDTAVFSMGMPYSDTAERMAGTALTREQQERIKYLLNRERVLDAFDQRENFYTVDYQRKKADGTIIWANTTVRTYQNPSTGDVMSFMYSFDIDAQKTTEAIIDRVVDTNFEYLILFNTVTGLVERTIDKAEAFREPKEGRAYEEFIAESLREELSPSNYEMYMPQFQIKAVAAGLKKEKGYSVSCELHENKTQSRHYKLWNFNWFDEDKVRVLCSRSDITEVQQMEQRQKEALTAALAAAKQANAAKSDFLSRMSHEIRTPMNAIIGMTAIAAQSMGNEEQVSDCISKIGISSRFLLSLINDILDMSRIESGKMLLKNEKIPFEEFLNGINAICHAQAASKDVDYECIADPVMDDYYMGDAMKLQQVLINVLGNAIKFTGSGGKVTFSVAQRRKTKNDAILRFIINDTGVGIDEEFIPHLYEPFEQESTGMTTVFGGTGLGLAISKSIVDMMDGKIEVRSIKGVGTEFTIDVKLGITEEEKQRRRKKQTYNFSHLRTLVVDDDVVVCESAVILLKEMGIAAEWVDSGRKAVDCVRDKWQQKKYYDMILIDWKMPEMDGIETTKRIRQVVGPDVTIIIMTAYDWSAIEHEARAAGVNLLMSKPMFKSSLISAFSRVFGQKEEEKPRLLCEEFDFTGKRLLLVEDHPMNAEIAKMLLEDKGMTVEIAENGLRALEMYSKTEPGYYDVILMDIRMPIMDGLQASINIRHLSNADAGKIPIIAMTANAFDDDVDKSKAAGMNAHLTKPIDPPKLYQTLYDFVYGKEAGLTEH